MRARILLTCVGGTMMPDLLTSLHNDPVLNPYLIGVDASPAAIGRDYVDIFYQTPWGEDPNYVDEIAKIVAKEKVDLVLPCSDSEAFSLAAGRAKIYAAGAVVLASPTEVLEQIKDKNATYIALKAAGVRVPEYKCVMGVSDLRMAINEFGYPRCNVIVKPVAGRGGRGMRVLVGTEQVPASWIGAGAREKRIETLASIDEMETWFADGALMVMPTLHAPVHDVDVFAKKGEARMALVRRRVNPAGIPFVGNRIVSDQAIIKYSIDIAEALKLDGLHDIDLMTDAQGRPGLLEVNPRPSGSVAAAHAAGFPIVASAIAETLGQPYPLSAPSQDIDVGMAPRAIRMIQALNFS